MLVCCAAILLVATSSCRKAGTGGKSTVSGYVMHHSKRIPSAVVYIKYGAKEFPGTDVSVYDASVTAGTDAHYEIKNLRKGDYYIYAVGWDDSILQQVSGGISVKLKYDKATTTDIPVTEP